MPERLRAFLEAAKKFWAGLPTPKRLALVFVVSAVLVGTVLVATIGSQPKFVYLYTDLATQDAASIKSKLETQQVPIRLENGGTAIMVPEERVHALRLELAAAGLPRGTGVGFEIFDRSQIGATEFEQQISLRRALEGELARSIMTVDGVKSARVHLVLPEHRLFTVREESASASVVLKLENAQNFGRKEVAAIVHLVAAAVPGLSRDRVSVVSTEGLTLHRPVSDASQSGVETNELQAEQSRRVGTQLESDLRDQLERIVGPGNADVRVNVTLDAAAREKTEEHYSPERTALRSEHKVEETTGPTTEAGVAGVPGARSNLPDAPPGEQSATEKGPGGGVTRKTQTRNWEVDRVTEKTTTPPGGIGRLSVAVLVNGKYEKHGAAATYVPRTQAELDEMTALVKHAVGFDAARGDAVEVKSAEFTKPTTGTEDAEKPASPYKKYLPYAAAGGGALFLLAVVILVWRIRSKKKLPVPAAVQALGGAPGVKEPALAAMDQPRAALPEASPADSADLRAQALELATKDPATAAIVIRKWLSAAGAQATARS
ncbi:MAG TPA: flagellar basal-body MS-ring/collar protein FliF [Polyangiaceae bacterium]|nr:flagellar basal-body MS-ring/collar protein FliF [Polyangiaceae bacterium]